MELSRRLSGAVGVPIGRTKVCEEVRWVIHPIQTARGVVCGYYQLRPLPEALVDAVPLGTVAPNKVLVDYYLIEDLLPPRGELATSPVEFLRPGEGFSSDGR